LRFTFLFWWWPRYFGLPDAMIRHCPTPAHFPSPWSAEKSRHSKRRLISFLFFWALLIFVGYSASKIRYLVELEPPAQYDHPYNGQVVERIMPVAEVRALCTSVGASGRFVACAWVSDGACHVVLPNDEPATVFTYRRHEIAHCNGWPANHPHG
jgi:hypothetical protein